MSDWGGHVPENAGRLVRAKLTPKRLVIKLCQLSVHVVATYIAATAAIRLLISQTVCQTFGLGASSLLSLPFLPLLSPPILTFLLLLLPSPNLARVYRGMLRAPSAGSKVETRPGRPQTHFGDILRPGNVSEWHCLLFFLWVQN